MMRAFDAVLFDPENVIYRTDEYHYIAWKSVANDIGVYFDAEMNGRLRGVSRRSCLDIILENSSETFSDAEKEELAEQKNEIFKEMLSHLSADDLKAEARDTLTELHRRGYLLGVVSASKNLSYILRQIGLGDFFDLVYDGNITGNGNPLEEIIKKAAHALEVQPERCLMVWAGPDSEDNAPGGLKMSACCGDLSKNEYHLRSFEELLEVLR